MSYAYISRIEAGTRQPSVKALRRLAKNLGVTAGYLETGSELDRSEELELRLTDLELAVRLGDDGGAEEQLREILAEALAAVEPTLARRARAALAVASRGRGDYPAVVTMLEQATADEPFAPLELYELYAELARAYAATGRPEAGAELLERCLAGIRASDDLVLETRCATALSHVLGDAGELGRAEAVVQETLERVQPTEDAYTRVRLYWSLARDADAQSRPALALANARKAITLLETTEDTLDLARAHLLAAGIAIARSDGDDATGHLDHAERLLGTTPAVEDVARLAVRRSQVAALLGESTPAVELARTAIDLLGDELPAERGTALLALADGLTLQNDHAGAHDAYGEAVTLLERQRRWREATLACRAWARMLRAAGREDEALDVLERASELGLRASPAEVHAGR